MSGRWCWPSAVQIVQLPAPHLPRLVMREQMHHRIGRTPTSPRHAVFAAFCTAAGVDDFYPAVRSSQPVIDDPPPARGAHPFVACVPRRGLKSAPAGQAPSPRQMRSWFEACPMSCNARMTARYRLRKRQPIPLPEIVARAAPHPRTSTHAEQTQAPGPRNATEQVGPAGRK